MGFRVASTQGEQNMGRRLVMGLVAVVAIVAVGGVGFAAFTTSAYINGNSAAGTFGPLTWSNLGTPVGSESFDQCGDFTASTLNTSDTLNLTAYNLAPGDSCTFTANLNNLGSIPANVYSTVDWVGGTGGCSVTYALDNFGYQQYEVTNGPITIGGHSYLAYSVTVGINSGLGNEYQGITCSWVDHFTATAGS